jgi:hypothetical protein
VTDENFVVYLHARERLVCPNYGGRQGRSTPDLIIAREQAVAEIAALKRPAVIPG